MRDDGERSRDEDHIICWLGQRIKAKRGKVKDLYLAITCLGSGPEKLAVLPEKEREAGGLA